MSDGNRSHHALFGIVLTAFAVMGGAMLGSKESEHVRATESATAAYSQPKAANDPAARPDVVYQSNAAEARQENDLEAQWHAANANWAGAWVSFYALIGLVVTVYFAYLAWQATHETNEMLAGSIRAEQEPAFTVDLQLPDNFAGWRGRLPSMLFRMRNEGSSVAIVTAVYRAWHVARHSEGPQPIQSPEERPGWSRAAFHVPVGAGQTSHFLRTFSERCEIEVTEKDWMVFYGYIESENLAGEKFEDGFAVAYSFANPDLGLHVMPTHTGAYSYHRKRK